jgi:PmbA protein
MRTIRNDKLSERIVETALGKGADSVQALKRTFATNEVSFENDRLKTAESSQRTQIEVRVIKNGKVGFSITTDPRDIDSVADRALEAAEFGSTAHFEMPSAQHLHPVKTYDPALLPLAKPEMIQLGKKMMDRIKAYNPEILAGAGVGKTVTEEELANSSGASYSADYTDFGAGAGGQLVRGTDILFAGHEIGQKKRAVDVDEIADRAIGYFRMAEHIAPIQTGKMPVIFTPRGFSVLLLSLMLGLDGKNVLLGASPLRDKMGQAIANARFTLEDDPLVDYGPKSGAFDDEGVPRQRLSLIEEGILRNFIYDLDTAGRAGAKATGHGVERRYTNLIISPGDVPYHEMLGGMKYGLLVHEFLGMGQGNPINGDFSINLSLGYRIENGEIVGRVKDVMLAGNAYDALKNITALSREREWVSGSGMFDFYNGLSPYIQVSELSAVAK